MKFCKLKWASRLFRGKRTKEKKHSLDSLTHYVLPQNRCPLEKCERNDHLVLEILSYCNLSAVMRSKRVSKRWLELCNRAIDDNYQPTKVFTDGEELRAAARQYCFYRKSIYVMDRMAVTYGFPIGKWQVGEVEDFKGIFAHERLFNEDISNWDLSKATTMEDMFCYTLSFNQPLDRWNTGKVQNMNNVFNGARCFDQPLGNWNTSNVKTMNGMFADADLFNQSLRTWNTSKVQHMESMFVFATSFNQPLLDWDFSSLHPASGYKSILRGALAFQQELPKDWKPEVVFQSLIEHG